MVRQKVDVEKHAQTVDRYEDHPALEPSPHRRSFLGALGDFPLGIPQAVPKRLLNLLSSLVADSHGVTYESCYGHQGPWLIIPELRRSINRKIYLLAPWSSLGALSSVGDMGVGRACSSNTGGRGMPISYARVRKVSSN